MVQIIEHEQHAGGAKCIRFRPYRSKRRQNVILAHWQHAMEPVDPKGPAPIPGHTLGTPVDIELIRAMDVAHEDGIPFVWIDDPDGLFPPPGLLNHETVETPIEGQRRKIRFLNPEIGLITTKDPIPLHISAYGPRSQALTAKLNAGWKSFISDAPGARGALRSMQALSW
jgi:hypothetical protein